MKTSGKRPQEESKYVRKSDAAIVLKKPLKQAEERVAHFIASRRKLLYRHGELRIW
jgi:hypothetical protein